MAYKKEKDLAIKMRKSGMSYSQIREKVHVSKSTLSLWLEAYPLTRERLRELRDISPQRIESFRATMKKKRDVRIAVQEARVIKDLAKFSHRELFVAGFFLFWGEGTKVRTSMVSLTNTDPSMIRFFLKWIFLLGGTQEHVRFALHLYSDMNIEKELQFWSKAVGYPRSSFTKPYIKKTKHADITYKTGFGHGTCNVRYMNQNLNDYILMGLKYIRGLYEMK